MSLMAVKVDEDRTYAGAFVAAPTVRWGASVSADTGAGTSGAHGYHAVWTRDEYEMATALQAAADSTDALAALSYILGYEVESNGAVKQNTWLNGTAVFGSLQMDEVADPIILAYQLGATGSSDWAYVKELAGCLVANGPYTPEERWEENGPSWHRYSFDGYGETASGGDYAGSGAGNPWPVLTGERGEYDVADGNISGAQSMLQTMAGAANSGGRLPVQVHAGQLEQRRRDGQLRRRRQPGLRLRHRRRHLPGQQHRRREGSPRFLLTTSAPAVAPSPARAVAPSPARVAQAADRCAWPATDRCAWAATGTRAVRSAARGPRTAVSERLSGCLITSHSGIIVVARKNTAASGMLSQSQLMVSLRGTVSRDASQAARRTSGVPVSALCDGHECIAGL